MKTPVSDLADFSTLETLRVAAARRDPSATAKTARQFESLFAQQLVKTMRQASFGNSLFPDESKIYRDLYDREIAKRLTQGKGLGLAPMIRHALGDRSDGAARATRANEGDSGFSLAGYRRALPVQHPLATAGNAPAAATKSAVTAVNSPTPAAARRLPLSSAFMTTPHGPGPAPPQHDANSSPPPSRSAPDRPFSSPESFVAAVWPHARRVAAKLGVSAKALIAQAALETGWGKHIGGSHNLFGIKANRSWSGDRAELKTTEYVDGAFRRETASFRGYDSIAQSFDDYAHFLASNPRYAAALGVGDDPARFAHELQKAGYATDPAYAAKIARIARSDVFDDALKIPAEQPLLALR